MYAVELRKFTINPVLVSWITHFGPDVTCFQALQVVFLRVEPRQLGKVQYSQHVGGGCWWAVQCYMLYSG